MSDEAEKNWNAALHEMAIDTMDELRAERDHWMQDSALHAQDVIRLTKANAELREVLRIIRTWHKGNSIAEGVIDQALANSSEGEMSETELSCEGCDHRWWVQPKPFASSRPGWGCLATGGHATTRCQHYTEVATRASANSSEGE